MNERICNRCKKLLTRGQEKFCSHACANRTTMERKSREARETPWKPCNVDGPVASLAAHAPLAYAQCITTGGTATGHTNARRSPLSGMTCAGVSSAHSLRSAAQQTDAGIANASAADLAQLAWVSSTAPEKPTRVHLGHTLRTTLGITQRMPA